MEVTARLKMNVKEQTTVIIENFVKMLYRRGLITNIDDTIKKIEINNKGTFTFSSDGNDFFLMIIFQKINGIKKGSELEENLIKSKGKKFVVAFNPTKKTYTQAKDFQMELFTTTELLVDLPSCPFVPEHILLTPEEKNEIIQKYQEKNISKILSSDMMVRYLGANKGDIIKIIRKTVNTGESIYYRRVY